MKQLWQIWGKILVVCAIVWMAAACAFADAGPEPGGEYIGVIGQNMKIHMSLERQGDKISGWYYYDAYGSKLALEGRILNERDFKFYEYDADGNETGIFYGVYKDGRLEGTWMGPDDRISPDEKTKYSFWAEKV